MRHVLRPLPTIKLGFFGCNLSGGTGPTSVPERWDGSWDHNLELAKVADEAGLDFLIPVARFLGYQGETDFQGSGLDPIAWAAALLASTEGIPVFSTVHTAFTHPVLAAKQTATLDAIGHGRFALNVVAGWNTDEYQAFGRELPAEHAVRYGQAEEWLTIVRRIWAGEEFDWDGEHFRLRGVRGKPSPEGGAVPVMNAGSSQEGKAFAVRNSDILFTAMLEPEMSAGDVAAQKAAAGRPVQVFTGSYTVCRPTRAEALEYHRYMAEEHVDAEGLERLMTGQQLTAKSFPPELFDTLRIRFAAGHGGFPLVGSPDDVADAIRRVHEAGFDGLTLGSVNHLLPEEFPYVQAEVLPRLEKMGVWTPRTATDA